MCEYQMTVGRYFNMGAWRKGLGFRYRGGGASPYIYIYIYIYEHLWATRYCCTMFNDVVTIRQSLLWGLAPTTNVYAQK